MAILMTLQVLGGTAEQYDRVNESLGIQSDDDAPDGLIQHVCGLIDDGVLIFDVWESEAKLDAFFARALPEMQKAGVPESQPVIEQIHNLIARGGADTAGVIMEIHVDADADIYDAMVNEMPSHQGDVSEGPWFSHAAAVTGTGNLHVVDIWPSPDAFGAFAEAEIAPAAAGRMDEITPRFVPVYNVIRGKAAH